METIKVNMNPNPLDVQTIHASQNDGEARQWEFELHNNGELIDTSDITEQLFFKAYKGGTEQILPENTSTPTTSPFKGDIRYPQGLLTDQEFTYRQSPTEEDGLAKITDIKGNTIVWNQLIHNGNFADGTGFAKTNLSLVVSANVGTILATAQGASLSQQTKFIANHKFLGMVDIKLTTATNKIRFHLTANNYVNSAESTDWQRLCTFGSYTSDISTYYPRITDARASDWDNVQIKNFMAFDLTAMFGAGNEPTTVDEFTALFPLPYYAYESGKLLSFNGTGIKVTGKNLVFKILSSANLGGDGTIVADNQNMYDLAVAEVVEGKQYHIGNNRGDSALIGWFTSEPQIGSTSYDGQRVVGSTLIPIAPITGYIVFRLDKPFAKPTFNLVTGNIDYEPYTSSTLSLPVSTYFPNGMDGVGTDYDELTNTKATTRMTRVDLGSLTWTKESRQNRFNSRALEDAKSFPSDSVANAICAKYITITADDTYFGNDGLSIDSGGRVNIYDSAYASATASDFKTAMSGVYLVYPLATPTETSFTTASLVTENAEIPLSNDDGVLIGKCTEELSAEPGFHDAKIKLSDSDGDVYSNKLQLHVERKP